MITDYTDVELDPSSSVKVRAAYSCKDYFDIIALQMAVILGRRRSQTTRFPVPQRLAIGSCGTTAYTQCVASRWHELCPRKDVFNQFDLFFVPVCRCTFAYARRRVESQRHRTRLRGMTRRTAKLRSMCVYFDSFVTIWLPTSVDTVSSVFHHGLQSPTQGHHKFLFHKVFGPDSSQREVFQEVRPCLFARGHRCARITLALDTNPTARFFDGCRWRFLQLITASMDTIPASLPTGKLVPERRTPCLGRAATQHPVSSHGA